MLTLQKEIWTDQVMQRFYPDTSFLKYAKDFSQFVEYNKINLAEAGVDPIVYINNTTYPIPVSERTDTPISVELDTFDTENTLVRYPEAVELAYDKMESVITGHRETLRATTGEKAAHAYGPQSNGLFTPVILTSGECVAGRKRLTSADIIILKGLYDAAEIPLESRYLVLHPTHVGDLISEDLKAFKDIVDLKKGEPRDFVGFKMLQFLRTPTYNPATLEKLPFRAIGGAFSSFSFSSEEVMKADGDLKMFARVDDPEQRATIIGFHKRFIALPIRNKGNGAIVSAPCP